MTTTCAACSPRRRCSRTSLRTGSTHAWGSRNAPGGGRSRTGGHRGSACGCAGVPTCRPPAARRARSSARPWPSAGWKRAGSPSAAGAPGPCTRPSAWGPPWRPQTCCAAAAGLLKPAGGPWWGRAGGRPSSCLSSGRSEESSGEGQKCTGNRGRCAGGRGRYYPRGGPGQRGEKRQRVGTQKSASAKTDFGPGRDLWPAEAPGRGPGSTWRRRGAGPPREPAPLSSSERALSTDPCLLSNISGLNCYYAALLGTSSPLSLLCFTSISIMGRIWDCLFLPLALASCMRSHLYLRISLLLAWFRLLYCQLLC